MTTTLPSPKWRDIGAFSTWDAADSLRTATVNDTPTLDVRIVFSGGKHRVQISGASK